MEPLETPSVAKFVARMPSPARRDLVEWNPGERSAERFARRILDRQIPISKLLRPDPQIVVTDDHPFNEYYLLRRNLGAYRMRLLAEDR